MKRLSPKKPLACTLAAILVAGAPITTPFASTARAASVQDDVVASKARLNDFTTQVLADAGDIQISLKD